MCEGGEDLIKCLTEREARLKALDEAARREGNAVPPRKPKAAVKSKKGIPDAKVRSSF